MDQQTIAALIDQKGSEIKSHIQQCFQLSVDKLEKEKFDISKRLGIVCAVSEKEIGEAKNALDMTKVEVIKGMDTKREIEEIS